MFQIHTVAPEMPFLRAVARLLLDDAGADPYGMAADLVLLPSQRACASLRHLMLEQSGRGAVLTPRLLTAAGLLRDLGDRLPSVDPPAIPDRLRAAVLAPALAELPWLRKHPESAPGLAEELVDLFDDMRRHGIDPGAPEGMSDEPQGEFGELLATDLRRVAESWRLYRGLCPRDEIDRELRIVAAVAGSWPEPAFRRLTVAGFVSMTPTTAALLRSAAAAADSARLVMTGIEGEGQLSRLFAASFGDRDAETHPARPAARALAQLTGDQPPELGRDLRPYRERIAPLGDIAALFRNPGFPRWVPCSDPETESRVIAARVIEALRVDSGRRITVATADRGLARRVAAQLRDAGLTTLDDSGGAPLSTRGAGRLAWQLLRCATTGLNHQALLEVLTHPDVDFGAPGEDFGRKILNFEKEVLHGHLAAEGLAGYRRLAEKRDAGIGPHEGPARREPYWAPFVETIAPAFAGLLKLAGRRRVACAEITAALRASWKVAAPSQPLDDAAAGSPVHDPGGRIALADLLDEIDAASPALPPMTLNDFASLLSRLMGKVEVRTNRLSFLPVQITGLLEARLEHYDLLILGGMTEDVFPGREPRPLFLGQAWRRRMELRDWRHRLAEQADLFHRLLHNGREVMVTWPCEKNGQPALPSPLISRLTLGLDEEDQPRLASPPPLYRPVPPDAAAMISVQQDFIAEGPSPARHVETPAPRSVSHSSLAIFRACPYRHLLERGFGLREEQEVLEDLRARDVGETSHLIMKRFLQPGGEGSAALVGGDRDAALRILARIADESFHDRHGDLPQLNLWRNTFLAGADSIVDFEIGRASAWRPAACEASFSFSLGDLHQWLDSPSGLEPSADEAAVALAGRIDRIDTARDGSESAFVIDYKTGSRPTARDVSEQRDLQLPIYALAAAIGGIEGMPAASSVAGGAYYGLAADTVGFGKPQMADASALNDQARTVLATALEAIRAGASSPLVPDQWGDPDPDACRFCPFRGVCRYDERLNAPEPTRTGGGA